MRIIIRRVPFAALALGLPACSGPDPHDGAVARDSAGVEIVENTGPLWREGQGWRVAPVPHVTIGVLEGPEEYQLFRVRSAIRLPDGHIVVANGGTYELRFYDANGEFLKSIGREGEGPGEFKSMGSIWRGRGDSLVIYDYTNAMRLSVFDRNGTFGRSFRLDAPGASIPLATDLIWGTTVISMSGIYPDGDQADGLRRDSALYCTQSLDGAVLDTLGRFPGSEILTRNTGDGMSIAISAPFGRHPVTAAAGDRWYFGSSDRYEFQGFRRSGELDRLIRRDVANRPVPADLAAAVQMRTPAAMRSGVQIPETMPAYGRLLGDAEGDLWVQQYRVGDEPERWDVFDPDGRFLGTVEMPAAGRVTEIGPDYVLGVWTDDMDVEQVRLYALSKNR